MKEMIAQRMTEFGQAVHAGDYQPIPLAEVAKRNTPAKPSRSEFGRESLSSEL